MELQGWIWPANKSRLDVSDHNLNLTPYPHQNESFRFCFFCLWQMQVHFITVKVSIVWSTHTFIETKRSVWHYPCLTQQLMSTTDKRFQTCRYIQNEPWCSACVEMAVCWRVPHLHPWDDAQPCHQTKHDKHHDYQACLLFNPTMQWHLQFLSNLLSVPIFEKSGYTDVSDRKMSLYNRGWNPNFLKFSLFCWIKLAPGWTSAPFLTSFLSKAIFALVTYGTLFPNGWMVNM